MNVQLSNVISDIIGDDDSDPGVTHIKFQKCTTIQSEEALISRPNQSIVTLPRFKISRSDMDSSSDRTHLYLTQST
ncbi:MAG: hypothetical protein DID90_2727554741 [Candidatus Nitrotoga sp. LAW]|nr:MAG: hypothetical protein DID90_2727554741 [Candidatus Nitrotoga sp. LAW]